MNAALNSTSYDFIVLHPDCSGLVYRSVDGTKPA